eukprot:Polyplicarium_translucidae@DN2332_c0_g1_i4.p2
MTLSHRFQFLALLFDDGSPLEYTERRRLRKLYQRDPLGTYLSCRQSLVPPQTCVRLKGLLSLPDGILILIVDFLGHPSRLGFYRLCRAGGDIVRQAKRVEVSLRRCITVFDPILRDLSYTTPRSRLHFEWLVQRMLEVDGFCLMERRTYGKPFSHLVVRSLFGSPGEGAAEDDWEAAWNALPPRGSRVLLPSHIRRLTVRSEVDWSLIGLVRLSGCIWFDSVSDAMPWPCTRPRISSLCTSSVTLPWS